MPMFHLLKVLIINALWHKNETWNKKRLKVNIMYAYVRARKERVLTSRQPRPRVGIANLGFEPPSWQCILFIILYLLVKASSLDKQMPTRGRVAPRLGRVPPAGEDASPLAEEYENPSHLLVIY